jgi:hypothetical protein
VRLIRESTTRIVNMSLYAMIFLLSPCPVSAALPAGARARRTA